MKKYIKPSIEISELEINDVILTSGIEDNGESTYDDGKGNVIFGKEGTFSTLFDSIF